MAAKSQNVWESNGGQDFIQLISKGDNVLAGIDSTGAPYGPLAGAVKAAVAAVNSSGQTLANGQEVVVVTAAPISIPSGVHTVVFLGVVDVSTGSDNTEVDLNGNDVTTGLDLNGASTITNFTGGQIVTGTVLTVFQITGPITKTYGLVAEVSGGVQNGKVQDQASILILVL